VRIYSLAWKSWTWMLRILKCCQRLHRYDWWCHLARVWTGEKPGMTDSVTWRVWTGEKPGMTDGVTWRVCEQVRSQVWLMVSPGVCVNRWEARYDWWCHLARVWTGEKPGMTDGVTWLVCEQVRSRAHVTCVATRSSTRAAFVNTTWFTAVTNHSSVPSATRGFSSRRNWGFTSAYTQVNCLGVADWSSAINF